MVHQPELCSFFVGHTTFTLPEDEIKALIS
jgi:hypothetical protein